MLDDLKEIHNRDTADAFGIVQKQAQQLAHSFGLPAIDISDITNIVYAGMGSSPLAAQMSLLWPGYKLPFEIIRQYDLPQYVSQRTLCIAASYSGNTEETLSAVKQAQERGAAIVVITAGGKLAEMARSQGYPLALLPQVVQPRYAALYNFKAILEVLEKAGLVSDSLVQLELASAIAMLDAAIAGWRPEVPTGKNPAKQLAQELMGRSVVIYSGPLMVPAAYKWKIAINENAKQLAWYNTLPEFNHNEFMGWTEQPVDRPYAVIDIRSSLEHARVLKRFEVSERLLSGRRPAPIIVRPEGKGALQQLLWTLALGDYVSLYLGILNGLYPTPVELVEKFKKEMEA